jgi:hypothetical protein
VSRSQIQGVRGGGRVEIEEVMLYYDIDLGPVSDCLWNREGKGVRQNHEKGANSKQTASGLKRLRDMRDESVDCKILLSIED